MNRKILVAGLSVLLIGVSVQAVQIDMEAIKQIESGGNPEAVSSTGARGLYQIMPITLKAYNQRHKAEYSENDLFNPSINEKIARWYLEIRIPELLRYYNLEVDLVNVLWSYNAGIGRVRNGIMPEETERYIKKYMEVENE